MIAVTIKATLIYPGEWAIREKLGDYIADELKNIDGDGSLDVDDLEGGSLLAGLIVETADSCEIEVEGFDHR